MYRDLTMKEISEQQIGQTLQVAGWVENIRDHGGVSFIDLRDMYGVLQVVIRKPELLKGITKEMCLSITGLMEHRDEETYNPKIPSGTIELEAHKIDVLGRVYKQLPFEIQTSKEIREDVRLKYRYLDLRNAKVKDNIVFRSKVISYLRQKMTDMGFLEIQTPILCASSPEGARDYIVPSRKFKGKFYALPQAPQQYKQLLMASGFDKYFQIAPCFRDEDARADRSPGEFYQLDMEMAFASQEDVFSIVEQVLPPVFEKYGIYKEASKAPFVRIPYLEAMDKYGSDKPDLRNPLVIQDATAFFNNSGFGVYDGKAANGEGLRAIVIPGAGEKPRSFFDKLDGFAKEEGFGGMAYVALSANGAKGIAKFFSEEKMAELKNMFGVKDGDAVVFMGGNKKLISKFAGKVRTKLGEELDLVEKDAFRICWIVDFPFYEENEETGAVEFSHNPFSMPQGGMDALLNKNPFEILAYQYDMVCNGVELASGAVRNHKPEIMYKAFELAGYDHSVVDNKFGGMINAFKYGAPPHAGCAPGIDRTVMLLLDEPIIRDVILFPLNGKAQDLLMQAPNTVSEQQLKDLHLDIKSDALA